MTTYGEELTINQINERYAEEKHFQDEIYDEAFFKHPVLQIKTSVKPYIIIKAIYDMCITDSYFDDMIYPTDIIIKDDFIEEHINDIFDVEICGIMYRLSIDTTEGIKEWCIEYTTDNISNISKTTLFNHIKHSEQVKEVHHIEGEDRTDEIPTPEIIYDETSCPVCFDEIIDFDDWDEGSTGKLPKTVGMCGHTLCAGCHHSITHSNNSRCPVCRSVWDNVCYESNSSYTEILWTQEDIDELCEAEDNDTLSRIIDVDELVDTLINDDGYEEILGYDTSVEVGGLYDTPDKYRELSGGGYEYVVMIKTD